MKDFYSLARFRMSVPSGVRGVSGGLIFPAGIPAHTLERRKISKKHPHLRNRLLDPQLYLATLSAATSRNTCTNLASYGWFATDGIAPYESAEKNQRDWKNDLKASIPRTWKGVIPESEEDVISAVLTCVQTQESIGCEALILPGPLTTDQSSDYGRELQWLDFGLRVASTAVPGKPRLATIALSDTCLRGFDPWTNHLLDVIIDQVTARSLEGAYIVIEQANEQGYYCSHPNTVGSILRLVHALKEAGLKRVVVGPAGFLGLLALTVGADVWSTGWYRGERLIKLANMEDKDGRAVPTYYSHALASEIHLESDISRLGRSGVFARLEDETDASSGLLRALREGKEPSVVPEWRHRPSNIGAAMEHFLIVATRETAALASMTKQSRLRYATEWLENAEQLAINCYEVGGFNQRTELNHQSGWLQAFRRLLQETGEKP